MKTTSLEILEKAELPTQQAHAILKVLEQEMTTSQENLATRADIAELRLATKADIAELRSATKADIAELRSATKADIAEVRLANKADLNKVEGSLARWVLTCFLGQTAVLMGWTSFLLAHSAGR